MAKKTETIGFEEQADDSQSAPEFGSHEGAEFESEVIPGADSSADGEGIEFESEETPGVETHAGFEEDVYTVVDNFWWNGKNRLKGTQIVLTPEEYNKLSEHVYQGEQ
jgi:hypothetical protein